MRERGHAVVAMDNRVCRGSESNIDRLEKNGITFVHGDVRCIEDFKNLPSGIDLICDASAQPSLVPGYSNPTFDLTNNELGVINVLEFAQAHHCPLFFFSTNRIYSAYRINALPRHECESRLKWDPAARRNLPVENRLEDFDPEFGISEEFSLDGSGESTYGGNKLIADGVCRNMRTRSVLGRIVNRLGVISGAGKFGKLIKDGSYGGPWPADLGCR